MTWHNGGLLIENRHGQLVDYKQYPLSVPDHPSLPPEVGGGSIGSPGYATMQKLLAPPYRYKLVNRSEFNLDESK
jgi:hypothetical protein